MAFQHLSAVFLWTEIGRNVAGSGWCPPMSSCDRYRFRLCSAGFISQDTPGGNRGVGGNFIHLFFPLENSHPEILRNLGNWRSVTVFFSLLPSMEYAWNCMEYDIQMEYGPFSNCVWNQERAAKANVTVVRPDSHSPDEAAAWVFNKSRRASRLKCLKVGKMEPNESKSKSYKSYPHHITNYIKLLAMNINIIFDMFFCAKPSCHTGKRRLRPNPWPALWTPSS